MTPLVIIGAGGLAREVCSLLRAQHAAGVRDWGLRGFVSEFSADHGKTIHGLPVLGDLDALAGIPGVHVVCGIGHVPTRARLAARLTELAIPAATLIHPRAVVGSQVGLGAGTVVQAGAVLTEDIEVGAHVYLNLNVTVGHDAKIGAFSVLSPAVNLAGNADIGEGCEFGINASVLPKQAVGSWSIVGSGAVVTRSLPADCTAVGMPAKVIKQRDPGWWQ